MADARNDPTFLLAPVEIVAAYELANLPRRKVEELLHRFFERARPGQLFITDRFGKKVYPREWFYVLPDHVGQAAKLIQDGTLHLYPTIQPRRRSSRSDCASNVLLRPPSMSRGTEAPQFRHAVRLRRRAKCGTPPAGLDLPISNQPSLSNEPFGVRGDMQDHPLACKYQRICGTGHAQERAVVLCPGANSSGAISF